MDFEFKKNDTGYTLTKYIGSEENVTVPERYQGEPITAIGDSAFFASAKIKSVKLPEGILQIGAMAFCNCKSLRSIKIPEGVKTIKRYAFSSCESLKEVELPNSLAYVEDYAFEGVRVECYIMPASVPFRKDNKVDEYSITRFPIHGLKKLVISSGEMIPPDYFSRLPDLEEVVIDYGVRRIGARAFKGCYKLKSVVLPSSINIIGTEAFSMCSSLDEISIPDGLTVIEESVFQNSGLKNIELHPYLTEIKKNAFSGCASLSNVTIIDRERRMRMSLTALCDIERYYSPDFVEDGEIYSKQDGDCEFDENKPYKDALFNIEMKKIGAAAFSGCVSLSELYLPRKLEEVAESAFSCCGGLRLIMLPLGTIQIGAKAFEKVICPIYYCGKTEEYKKVKKGGGVGADVYFINDKKSFLLKGWHYVDGIPTKW